jgi:hypothetical protein
LLNFEYRIWRDMAGAGRHVWRQVGRRVTGARIVSGVSVESEQVAKGDAVTALKELDFARADWRR